MSYNSWHIYGYGLCVSDIEGLSTEKIQALQVCYNEFDPERTRKKRVAQRLIPKLQ